jgi:hypothetical protein
MIEVNKAERDASDDERVAVKNNTTGQLEMITVRELKQRLSGNQKVTTPKADENTFYVPSLTTKELIAEEVWRMDEKPQFLFRNFNSSTIRRADEITVPNASGRDIIYRPIDNDALRKRLVLVPRDYKECTFSQAFEAGRSLTLEMYDAEKDKVDEVGLLVGVAQSTHFLDRWTRDAEIDIPGMGKFAPIIAIRGPSGSGKDRLLNALRFNSYRPYYNLSTRRVPSIFRPMDMWRGTLCLSEMELGRSDESSLVTQFLNGRAYGVPFSRQDQEDVRLSRAFVNFGVTIATQRRPWEDNATEDRTVPFYTQKTMRPIASEEMDEWLRRGLDIMDMMLYLRLMHWNKVEIDKATRIEGVSPRLTAAILPLLAIKKVEPSYDAPLKVLESLEKQRRVVKSMTNDGVMVNLIWDKVSQKYFDMHNGMFWVGKKDEASSSIVPLTATDIAEDLKWGAKWARTVVKSLSLVNMEGTRQLRINGRAFNNPIYFNTQRLEIHLEDFVPDYKRGQLVEAIREAEKERSVAFKEAGQSLLLPNESHETHEGEISLDSLDSWDSTHSYGAYSSASTLNPKSDSPSSGTNIFDENTCAYCGKSGRVLLVREDGKYHTGCRSKRMHSAS